MTEHIDLPPLPVGTTSPMIYGAYYCASNMQDYARAAIKADRQQRGEPVAWPTHEFAIVVDRMYEGEGPSLAMWNGENYNFTDGDCYDREPDGSLDGYTAEWLTHHQLERRLFAAPQPAEPIKQNLPPLHLLSIPELRELAMRDCSKYSDDDLAIAWELFDRLVEGDRIVEPEPQPAESHVERARRIVDSWPEWKRNYALTKHDVKATQPAEPVKAPSEISRQLLGNVVDEVFDGAIEDVSVIEDIYRVIVREYGHPARYGQTTEPDAPAQEPSDDDLHNLWSRSGGVMRTFARALLARYGSKS